MPDTSPGAADARADTGNYTDRALPDGTLLVLLCVSIPSFMINLDSNIVAVSLSSIAHQLNADFASIEWVISAYTLSFASLLMPAGALADRYGRKRLLVIGLAIFTLASFLCGAAPNANVLNASRALQGVGAAMQLSAALATLSHTFRGAARARAFAFWGSVIGIAVALGPVAGGFITQHFGWEWAFYINVPVGLVMIALTLTAVTDSRDPEAKRIDIPGFVTFSTFLFLTTLALITGNHRGWTSTAIMLELGGAALLFAAFVWAETAQDRPMLDFGVFRRPTYLGASVAQVTFAATLITMLTYLPVYLQTGLGYGPQAAGFLMLPMALPLFVVPRIVAAYLTHVWSGRALLTLGLALIGLGLASLALVAPDFSYVRMIGGMLVAGTGAGILNGEVAKVGMTTIPPERAGMASGIAGTLRFSGIVLGFAALGALLYDRVAGYAGPTLAQAVTSGNLTGITGADHALALRGFGDGYSAILAAAAMTAVLASLLAWWLISAEETAPVR